MKKVLLALGFTLIATSAHAVSTTVTAGPFSPFADVTTVDFDAANPAGWSRVGGGLFTAPTQNNISAVPVGSTGNYLSVGLSSGQVGPAVITLSSAVGYYGFLWGSVDTFNSVELFNGSTSIAKLNGSTFNPNNGDRNLSIYLNIFADNASQYFDKIVFSSTSNAFETDNHAYASAVPVPAALPLLASALGAFGIARRRSNKAKAV